MHHPNTNRQARDAVEAVYRAESRRVFATLVRLLGDFDLAEESMHDAFASAIEQWPRDGVPANPRGWLISAGRFKGIDAMRRRVRHNRSLAALADRRPAVTNHAPVEQDSEEVEDDRLRLIFTCCHPALPPETRVALTLREVCGLTTEEIARAFLTSPPTVAQRIVRGKAKIREDRIPYRVPSRGDLPERLDAVLKVIYLVFNEGYFASSGQTLTRADLSGEAIRLGRLVCELMPAHGEPSGLLALMLLQESRRAARASPTGDVVLLEDQNRTLWNREHITQGIALMKSAMSSQRPGTYSLQAAIAAVHAQAPSSTATDWARIVAIYDALARMDPSPVVELNRAVAVAMRDGPSAGLELIDAILSRGDLVDYPLAHSARAELCRRSGKTAEAGASFQTALELASQEPQRRYLKMRLREIG